jgi:hypothetical protein
LDGAPTSTLFPKVSSWNCAKDYSLVADAATWRSRPPELLGALLLLLLFNEAHGDQDKMLL